MSDLICRKSMMRCQTPGMCSPHGGCGPSVLLDTDVRYSNISAGQGIEWTDERKIALTTALKLVAAEEENVKLKAELKKINADRKACWAELKVQGRYIDQLKAECEGLRADAARYRWLSQVSAMADKLEPEIVDTAMSTYSKFADGAMSKDPLADKGL